MRREPTGATIAALAAKQGGVVSRRQLMTDVGLSASAVDRRLRGGQLHLVHRGVYAVGHRLLRREGWWFAAVLASGAGAVVSHTDAAAALGLAAPRSGPVHVTLVARGRRRTTGVRTHCTRALPRAEVTTVDGLGTTSVGRTLLDLAPRCSERRLEQLISEADMRQRFDLEEVRAVLARAPTRQGAGRLACLLDRLEGVGAAFTRSDLEIAMLALCDAYDLPRPQANARVHGFEVDFWWPDARVVVETDSWRWHRMPTRREADAAKRLHLQAAGVRVVVLTFAQIRDAPSDVAHALRPPRLGRRTLTPVPAADAVRDVNDRLWLDADLVGAYDHRRLSPAEAHLLLRYREPLSGAVLELGPGAGRVTEYLADLAAELIAFELSPRMAAACRARVPRADVRERDLRAVGELAAASLDAVVATCNVLDVLEDDDRRAVLADVHRVLRPGGVLLFSSHNRDAPATRPWRPRNWRNPRALARQLVDLPASVRNHGRLAPLEADHATYALRNDQAHQYSMVLYTIAAAEQERQLAAAGFALEDCLTDDGREVSVGRETPTLPYLHYAARRPG